MTADIAPAATPAPVVVRDPSVGKDKNNDNGNGDAKNETNTHIYTTPAICNSEILCVGGRVSTENNTRNEMISFLIPSVITSPIKTIGGRVIINNDPSNQWRIHTTNTNTGSVAPSSSLICRPPIPHDRIGVAMTVIPATVDYGHQRWLAMGGLMNGSSSDACHMYDNGNNRWSLIKSLPHAHGYGAACYWPPTHQVIFMVWYSLPLHTHTHVHIHLYRQTSIHEPWVI
jgi:hypothetical protein